MEPRKLTDKQKRETIEVLYQKSKRLFPEVPEIVPSELATLKNNGRVLVVDVRRAGEQEVSMIPGALRSEEFEERSEEFEDATIVTYCTVGHRSGLYARRLLAQGWNVFNLKGSILSWTHMGGALLDADGPTRRVHVGGPQSSLAAADYEPVW